MEFMDITPKDEEMLLLLRENARMSVSEMARKMAVSRTAAQMRLQKLERAGVVEGYGVRISRAYTKHRVRALVMLKFPPVRLVEIQKALADIGEVTTVYSISGPYDLAGVVSAATMERLDAVIDAIGSIEGITDTMSSIILSTKLER